jgi:hypothetical protein
MLLRVRGPSGQATLSGMKLFTTLFSLTLKSDHHNECDLRRFHNLISPL